MKNNNVDMANLYLKRTIQTLNNEPSKIKFTTKLEAYSVGDYENVLCVPIVEKEYSHGFFFHLDPEFSLIDVEYYWNDGNNNVGDTFLISNDFYFMKRIWEKAILPNLEWKEK